MELTKNQLQSYSDKMGKEEIEMTAAILVKVLNHKYTNKKGGEIFKFQDIQQYYLRGSIPKAYGGHKVRLNTSLLGKTLTVFKD
tara:strand:- start:65150 stop:65401 length:252 start_codon:yes stop_codon:yes gene_type:complete